MGIIIYPPTIDWTWMKQRPQHLMYQLSQHGHTVFYCNKTQSPQDVEQIHPNLYIVHHHREWLKNTLPSIRKNHSFIGVWCSYPKLSSTLSSYQPDWVVYDCIDDFSDWSIYENEMISISNRVVCSSMRLFSRLQRTFPHKQIALIRNAYDLDMNLHSNTNLNLTPPPDLIIDNQKKLIGYVGAWAPWVDDKLVQKLSKIDPNLSVVIIGPEFGRKFQPKHTPQIHFLGLKPHCQLAGYIKHFSVLIIPFRITNVTLATNPVKAYEYLASGKPVISTNLPECRLMEPHIDVAQTHDEFLKLVKKRIIDPGDSVPRINYAMENTWAMRGQQVEEIIAELI